MRRCNLLCFSLVFYAILFFPFCCAAIISLTFLHTQDAFEETSYYIMAGDDNTEVQYTSNGVTTSRVLNRGENWRIEDVLEGDSLAADRPIQVDVSPPTIANFLSGRPSVSYRKSRSNTSISCFHNPSLWFIDRSSW